MKGNKLLTFAQQKLLLVAWKSLLMWLTVILSFSFLTYILVTYEHYEALFSHLKLMTILQYVWLAAVVLLLPVNLLLESLKWKMLVSSVQKIDLKSSFIAVLAGFSTGFFTPNRVGEMVGRILYLEEGKRKPGVTMSVLNSLTQNLIMVLCGVPACVMFFVWTKAESGVDIQLYLLVLGLSFVGFGLLYFFSPLLIRRIKSNIYTRKISSYVSCLSDYSVVSLLKILLVSLLRYFVFSLQFYFMLRFFGVDFSLLAAAIAIPTTYLFVTFTPTLAFSEAAVRSSFAVLFISAFSTQVAGIALAGVCIWMVNTVIPMLAGTIVMAKTKM